MATTCNHCGQPFNTSQAHPRRHCSIACEEGRGPVPIDDPSSDMYHRHLQGNPEALVGMALVSGEDGYIGKVGKLEDGEYLVEWEDHESLEVFEKRIDSSKAVSKIRQDEWWAE